MQPFFSQTTKIYVTELICVNCFQANAKAQK